MRIARSITDLWTTAKAWRTKGDNIAVVPTMGALHEGHLSLVRAALSKADKVIVTIFVNPKQFNDSADLGAYPRTEAKDAAKLETLGVHLLYAPGVEEIYPEGFSTLVSVKRLSEGLCGTHRPGYFDSVATVVAKLFLQTYADLAFFGEKDFQQLLVVRQMARDLNIPIKIIACPTVREPDGLALSSRNARLSAPGRRVAPMLSSALFTAAAQIVNGEPLVKVLSEAQSTIEAVGFERVEYLELRAESDLSPTGQLSCPARLLAAAWLDGIRLIDNVAVYPSFSTRRNKMGRQPSLSG